MESGRPRSRAPGYVELGVFQGEGFERVKSRRVQHGRKEKTPKAVPDHQIYQICRYRKSPCAIHLPRQIERQQQLCLVSHANAVWQRPVASSLLCVWLFGLFRCNVKQSRSHQSLWTDTATHTAHCCGAVWGCSKWPTYPARPFCPYGHAHRVPDRPPPTGCRLCTEPKLEWVCVETPVGFGAPTAPRRGVCIGWQM